MFMRNLGIYNRSLLQRSVRFNSNSTFKINWPEYFRLKKINNRLNVGSGAVTGTMGVIMTLGGLANVEIDPEKPILGLDPMITFVGLLLIGGLLGYLVGPTFGNTIFKLSYKKHLPQYNAMDKIFLQKVKVNRVNPSSQSFSNPVPDYYGERIYSLKDYKQWLRDCNAFRRKSQEFL